MACINAVLAPSARRAAEFPSIICLCKITTDNRGGVMVTFGKEILLDRPDYALSEACSEPLPRRPREGGGP
jgi:hypothetical protein